MVYLWTSTELRFSVIKYEYKGVEYIDVQAITTKII